jgi:solute carrier family 25 carnitine/acylcarnitine transporter 20/29
MATSEKSLLLGIVPGFAAGLSTLFVGQPFDTVKVRLQTRTAGATSFWGALRLCVREEGLLGLYKGTSPQLLGASVQHGVRYWR